MATRAQVLSTNNLSQGSASGPFTLHVAQNELFALNPGVLVFIITKGSFEMVLPAERKFVPLLAEFDSTHPCWVKGVEENNEAIIFEKLRAESEEKKADPPSVNTSEDSDTIVSREEPKRKLVPVRTVGSKQARLENQADNNVIDDSLWTRALEKANAILKGATLIVRMPNCAEQSAVIDYVAVNSLNNMCVVVKDPETGKPARAMSWLRSKLGLVNKDGSDQVWWNHAWIKTRSDRSRLDHIISWSVKARKSKAAIDWFLSQEWFNELEIVV